MGVIFSEHDARRIRKCVHAFERGGFGGKAEKRRHFNYDDRAYPYWSAYGGTATSVSATDPTSPTVCTLSVEQPQSTPDIWGLSSNVLTLADTGDYEVTLAAEMSGDTTGSVGIDVRVTVETFDGLAWDDWTVLALPWRVPAGNSGTNSVVLSKTITEEVTAYSGGRQFRVSGYKASSGDATCEVIPYLTFRKC